MMKKIFRQRTLWKNALKNLDYDVESVCKMLRQKRDNAPDDSAECSYKIIMLTLLSCINLSIRSLYIPLLLLFGAIVAQLFK